MKRAMFFGVATSAALCMPAFAALAQVTTHPIFLLLHPWRARKFISRCNRH